MSTLPNISTKSDSFDTQEGISQTPSRSYDLEDILALTRKIGILHDYVVEVILATYISKHIENRNPLWLMIVGEPSSNKTVLVSLLRNGSGAHMLDTMTPNAFISGMHEKEKPKDLLPLLNGKCLVVKDYTSLFGQSEETVKKVLGDMVSIYDGDFSKHSGARGGVSHVSSFSHLGCITPFGLNMRQKYMNMVGARFLILRMPALSSEEMEHCLKIAWDENTKQNIMDARVATSLYVDSICASLDKNGVQLRPIDTSIRTQLNTLAHLVAQARGEVKLKSNKFVNEDDEEVSFQELDGIQIEKPFRALHQLKALCRALAILRGKEEVGAKEVETARIVALSTMPVHRAETLSAFEWKEELDAKAASELLNFSYATTKRNFDALAYLEVLHKEKRDKTYYYKVHSRFKNILFPPEDVL